MLLSKMTVGAADHQQELKKSFTVVRIGVNVTVGRLNFGNHLGSFINFALGVVAS
jgi:hypothetical protein